MAEPTLIIVQVAFIIFIALLAFIAGVIPGIIPWCKNSTNFLSIANAFSGGVFMAIAYMHILPEVSNNYAKYMEHIELEETGVKHAEMEGVFPLPFALTFGGYAFILLIDKVIFDTHSLVGEQHEGHIHDPAQQQFAGNVTKSYVKYQRIRTEDLDHEDCIDEVQFNEGIKNYLSRHDKFAVRMSHALKRKSMNRMNKRICVKADCDHNHTSVEHFENENTNGFERSAIQTMLGNNHKQ